MDIRNTGIYVLDEVKLSENMQYMSQKEAQAVQGLHPFKCVASLVSCNISLNVIGLYLSWNFYLYYDKSRLKFRSLLTVPKEPPFSCGNLIYLNPEPIFY